MILPEPCTSERRRLGCECRRTSPEPAMSTSASSVGAISASPLPAMCTVAELVARRSRCALPEPMISILSASTLPLARAEPLPRIWILRVSCFRLSSVSVPEPLTPTSRSAGPASCTSRVPIWCPRNGLESLIPMRPSETCRRSSVRSEPRMLKCQVGAGAKCTAAGTCSSSRSASPQGKSRDTTFPAGRSSSSSAQSPSSDHGQFEESPAPRCSTAASGRQITAVRMPVMAMSEAVRVMVKSYGKLVLPAWVH